jgi:hypothetical protein
MIGQVAGAGLEGRVLRRHGVGRLRHGRAADAHDGAACAPDRQADALSDSSVRTRHQDALSGQAEG